MTYEEMLKYARTIAEGLSKYGWEATVLEEDATPGEPIPVSLSIDGVDFVIELNVL